MAGKYSSSFLEFVTSVGECKTKSEEKLFVEDEMIVVKNMVGKKRKTSVEEKEFLVRVFYLEMLGYDASFGYFEAVKLISQTNIFLKKLGYLFVTLYLPRNHSMRLLLMQQMQKDLENTNYLVVSMALEGVTNLVTEETLPIFVESLFKLLDHDNINVRKKAYGTLIAIYENGSSDIFTEERTIPRIIEKGICDPEISVMGTVLDFVQIYLERCDHSEKQVMKKLVSSLVDILKQITEGRLGKQTGYFFKSVPVPWIQIKILKIFTKLGKDDQHTSQHMYDILTNVLKKCSKIHETISYAVIVEAVLTIIHIYPNPNLISLADESIRSFLTHHNINMKYFGLNMLCALLRERSTKSETSRKIVLQYQTQILKFLSSRDETIQKLSMELLVLIANEKNIVTITKRLLSILRQTVDNLFATNIIEHIINLGEKLSPTIIWYLKVVNYIYEISPNSDIVRSSIPYQRVMRIIRSGYQWVSKRKDVRFKSQVVDLYLSILQDEDEGKRRLFENNDGIIRIFCWVVGEYGQLSVRYPLKEVFATLCGMLEWTVVSEDATKQWIVWAIRKMLVRNPDILKKSGTGNNNNKVLEAIGSLLEGSAHAVNLCLYRTVQEHYAMEYVTQRRVETEELEVNMDGEYTIDSNLEFLDKFVDTRREKTSSEESEMLRESVLSDLQKNESKVKLSHGEEEYMLFQGQVENGEVEAGGEGEGGQAFQIRDDSLDHMVRKRGGFVWDEEGFEEKEEEETMDEEMSLKIEKKEGGAGMDMNSTYAESAKEMRMRSKKSKKKKKKKKRKKKKILDGIFDGLNDEHDDFDEEDEEEEKQQLREDELINFNI